ncbi:MAG: methyltransferase domain-containing protein [Anaerolineae bacterium]|nr:methyltransferase domain-containing protein [Anaerolineae bacterium]
MSDLLQLVFIGTLIAAIGALGWWLLIASEGVYLGRRVVIWLYDVYAHRYEGVKNYFREYEELYLAKPIMQAITPQTNPLVLDVATGTGRLPLALARNETFEGHTIGVDLSRRMLHFATQTIFPYEKTATFIWCPAETLPFPDNSFDVVTCLEALEFMTSPKAVLHELVRVLRPGGLLLITQRINTKFMPGKTWTAGQVIEQLESVGIGESKAQIWQVDYRKVWGRKKGESQPVGVKGLDEVLRCPHCKQGFMKKQDARLWLCESCGKRAKVGNDGVIELFPLY